MIAYRSMKGVCVMFSRCFVAAVVAILGSFVSADFSAAQYASPADPRPLSRTGGAAGEVLNQIIRQDVGQGFNSQSLNLIALQNSRANVPFVGQQTVRGSSAPRIGLGLGTSSASKPFSSFTPDPTVSPYMNLFRTDFEGNSDLNYNTLVRPMLQQQAVNQQVQRQSMALQRQLQSVAAQSDFNPQGARDVYPTGHQTAFRYYGHYYPTMGRTQRRR
jgi:hypothetical protein